MAEKLEHWFGGSLRRDETPDRDRRERRAEPRVRTFIAGRIVSGDGFVSVRCTIRDLSLTGARVTVSHEARLPPPVALMLIRDGLLFDAAVAWRRGDETGLVLKGQHDLYSDLAPVRPRVRALWAELTSGVSAPWRPLAT
jgi:PilZ domain